MKPIRKVLHPTDFSEGAAIAFEHALHLARQHEAALHVLHVVPVFGEDPLDEGDEAPFFRRLWDEADAQLLGLVEAHQHRHVPLRRVLSRGVAAGPIIVDYARAEAIDVIVMGTQGRRGLRRLMLGSVAQEVIHRAPCPVLTVRRQPGSDAEARPIQRILVGIDFSEHAGQALGAARALAARYGAELHVLHVLAPLSFPVSITTTLRLEDLVPNIVEKTRARLEALFHQTPGAEVPVAFHVAEGHPTETLLAAADAHQADLLVVAPRGLSGVERFFLGSVAESVVRRASCPVFIARDRVQEGKVTVEADATAEEA